MADRRMPLRRLLALSLCLAPGLVTPSTLTPHDSVDPALASSHVVEDRSAEVPLSERLAARRGGPGLPPRPPPPTTVGLFGDLFSSLTSSAVSGDCPGRCYHALAALMCDRVLEGRSCGRPSMRCCAEPAPTVAPPPADGERLQLTTNRVTPAQQTAQTTAATTTTTPEPPSTKAPVIAEKVDLDLIVEHRKPPSYRVPQAKRIACPGVCVAFRIAHHCEAALDIPGACAPDQRCCVPRDLFDTEPVTPPEFVLLKKDSAPQQAQTTQQSEKLQSEEQTKPEEKPDQSEPQAELVDKKTDSESQKQTPMTNSSPKSESASSVPPQPVPTGKVDQPKPEPPKETPPPEEMPKSPLPSDPLPPRRRPPPSPPPPPGRLSDRPIVPGADKNICHGECITGLFSFFCERIDRNVRCSNGGRCCLRNRPQRRPEPEPTTPPAPVKPEVTTTEQSPPTTEPPVTTTERSTEPPEPAPSAPPAAPATVPTAAVPELPELSAAEPALPAPTMVSLDQQTISDPVEYESAIPESAEPESHDSKQSEYGPSYRPDYRPDYRPETGPDYSQGYGPEYRPGDSADYDTEYRPEDYPDSQGYSPTYGPGPGSEYSPDYSADYDNNYRPGYNPEYGPELNPSGSLQPTTYEPSAVPPAFPNRKVYSGSSSLLGRPQPRPTSEPHDGTLETAHDQTENVPHEAAGYPSEFQNEPINTLSNNEIETYTEAVPTLPSFEDAIAALNRRPEFEVPQDIDSEPDQPTEQTGTVPSLPPSTLPPLPTDPAPAPTTASTSAPVSPSASPSAAPEEQGDCPGTCLPSELLSLCKPPALPLPQLPGCPASQFCCGAANSQLAKKPEVGGGGGGGAPSTLSTLLGQALSAGGGSGGGGGGGGLLGSLAPLAASLLGGGGGGGGSASALVPLAASLLSGGGGSGGTANLMQAMLPALLGGGGGRPPPPSPPQRRPPPPAQQLNSAPPPPPPPPQELEPEDPRLICPDTCITPLLSFTCFGGAEMTDIFRCVSSSERCCAKKSSIRRHWDLLVARPSPGAGYPPYQRYPSTGPEYQQYPAQTAPAGYRPEVAQNQQRYPSSQEYSGQPGYAGQTGYTDQSGYSGQPEYSDQSGYTSQSGYANQAGYTDQQGYNGQQGYQPEYQGQPVADQQTGAQTAYPQEAGYLAKTELPDRNGYPDQAGYQEQNDYQDTTGYSDQTGYSEQAGYPGQTGYQHPSVYPDQSGYPDQTQYPTQEAASSSLSVDSYRPQTSVQTSGSDNSYRPDSTLSPDFPFGPANGAPSGTYRPTSPTPGGATYAPAVAEGPYPGTSLPSSGGSYNQPGPATGGVKYRQPAVAYQPETVAPTLAPVVPSAAAPAAVAPPSRPARNKYVCGVKGAAASREARVVGGSDAAPGEWCWHTALVNSQNQYLCGGALIGTQWVLTAAHCITNIVRSGDAIYVRVGDHDLTSKQGSPGAQTLRVSTTYIHHNHNTQTLDNDIALLRLHGEVDLTEGVCLVCLPVRGVEQQAGRRCTVSGYGYMGEEGTIPLRVRAAELPIVADDDCISRINSVTEKVFVLPSSSFCAGGEYGHDACQGDGGGPLVCSVDGYYELSGIVSWGFGCGRENVPGVYVKVASFIGWINQIISVNSLR